MFKCSLLRLTVYQHHCTAQHSHTAMPIFILIFLLSGTYISCILVFTSFEIFPITREHLCNSASWHHVKKNILLLSTQLVKKEQRNLPELDVKQCVSELAVLFALIILYLYHRHKRTHKSPDRGLVLHEYSWQCLVSAVVCLFCDCVWQSRTQRWPKQNPKVINKTNPHDAEGEK